MAGSRYATMALALTVAACGSTPQERGVSGAGLGAAGGAIIGAVTGLTVLQAALIGTGVGGATGLLTSRDQLDLGEPIWKGWFGSSKPGAQAAAAAPAAGDDDRAQASLAARTQAALATLGYDPGPVDGVIGPRTSEAIREYQGDHGLPADGRLTPDVARHIEARMASLPE